MSEGRREGLPPPKPMGRFVSSWIGDDRLAVAPLARPDVVSADGGPLKKRRQPPLLRRGQSGGILAHRNGRPEGDGRA